LSEAVWAAIGAFNLVVLAYFVLLNGVYLATSLFAFGALRRYAQRMKSLDLTELIGSSSAPPISLLAPAFNEERTCVESVRSLLTLEYPAYDVIVVNDGSADGTLERLMEAFALEPASRVATATLATAPVRQVYRSRTHPTLWLVDKENGGKADALNAGLNYCYTPIFCAMDADSLLEPEALIRIVRPFLEDATTIAAGGILRIANGCLVDRGRVVRVGLPDSLLGRFQVLEYLRVFLSGRLGWNALESTLIISGAFGVFRRSAVVEAGGYSTDTVGEDMELVVRLHHHFGARGVPHRVEFVPDPVAWTECPESLAVLSRQRDRWQRGLFQTLTRHRGMLLNPTYGKVGMLAFPYFFFLEMLGPVIEALGYAAFGVTVVSGRADLLYVGAFLALAVLLGGVLSLSAVALEELSFRRYPRLSDLLKLFGLAALENLGYRQMNTWWRVKGTWSALRRRKTWGKMPRRGFTTADRGAVT
jgi:cellulose synthase/poly-beta-1,6-N-acetylglucosamine synthase-like glycosyltransferase